MICVGGMNIMFFFFKQKTAYEVRISDWSSDVCSSDLSKKPLRAAERTPLALKLMMRMDGEPGFGIGGSGWGLRRAVASSRRHSREGGNDAVLDSAGEG